MLAGCQSACKHASCSLWLLEGASKCFGHAAHLLKPPNVTALSRSTSRSVSGLSLQQAAKNNGWVKASEEMKEVLMLLCL